MYDIEKVIETLKKRSVSIADIYERLKMERGYFDGRRRSVNEYKRRELAKQIVEAFPEYFEKENMVEETRVESSSSNEYKDKYIRLLEERLKDVEGDREFLRKVILEKLDKILKQ